MAMNTRKLTLLFTALVGLAVSAFAQSTATEATVARVTGTVTATLADGSTVAVTEGTKLPQGATITTGDKSEVFLVSHGDTTSVISANSVVEIAELSTSSAGGKVTEQKATLDLKSGNLVAKLNPAKKSVNQYSVRTPKGVAAARGTVFTVAYKGGNYTIAVVNGQVTVTPPANVLTGFGSSSRASIEVEAGKAFTNWNDGDQRSVNLNILNNNNNPGADESMRELLALAVATVTVAAQNGIGGTTAAEAAAVATAVFTAVPAVAEQAGALIKQSNDQFPPKDAAAAAAVLQTVTEATPPAAQGALTSGATTGTFTPSTQTTATDTPATNPGATNRNDSSPQQVTTPQPIDPSTVSRSN
jgi:hypothetical protein